jgi:hypothetical protein
MSAQTSDPLLELLQRYEAERAAFDEFMNEQIPDWEWDRIAEATWSRTQDEILEHQPPVTTATGAFLALDHVLRNEDLWELEQSTDQQMLWLLIKSVRDFIIDN